MEENKVSSFTVSPPVNNIKLTPGKEYSSEIVISNSNNSTETLHYKIVVSPYNVIGEDYSIDFSESTAYSKITNWVQFDKTEGEIPPNEIETVHYTIHVPEDANSGGQYCAISVQSIPEETSESGANISDVIEIATLVYSQVGDVIREGNVLTSNISAFSFGSPIVFTTTVDNTGNIHQNLQVRITAKTFLSGTQVDINPDQENIDADLSEEEQETMKGIDYYSEIVLPETTRTSIHTLEGLPSVGIYNVTAEIMYNNETIYNHQTVIMCPFWLLIIIIAALFFAIFTLITKIKSKQKKRA